MKVLTAVVSFEYIRMTFGDMYEAVKDFLCSKLDFVTSILGYDRPVMPQGDDQNVLWDILDFVRANFIKVEGKTFWDMMQTLPKMVSVAKAVGWIMENSKDLFMTVVELWTGEIRGRNKWEREVIAFEEEVNSFAQVLTAAVSTEIHGIEMAAKHQFLWLEQKRLEESSKHLRDGRPYFTIMLGRAKINFQKAHCEYENARRAAEKRAVPVWVYISGDAGVGKTAALEQLMANIWGYVQANAVGVAGPGKWALSNVFPMNQKENFWDGYTHQFFMQIDDLFQSEDVKERNFVATQLVNLIAPTPCALRSDAGVEGSFVL
jgi:hypothetical protein